MSQPSSVRESVSGRWIPPTDEDCLQLLGRLPCVLDLDRIELRGARVGDDGNDGHRRGIGAVVRHRTSGGVSCSRTDPAASVVRKGRPCSPDLRRKRRRDCRSRRAPDRSPLRDRSRGQKQFQAWSAWVSDELSRPTHHPPVLEGARPELAAVCHQDRVVERAPTRRATECSWPFMRSSHRRDLGRVPDAHEIQKRRQNVEGREGRLGERMKRGVFCRGDPAGRSVQPGGESGSPARKACPYARPPPSLTHLLPVIRRTNSEDHGGARRRLLSNRRDQPTDRSVLPVDGVLVAVSGSRPRIRAIQLSSLSGSNGASLSSIR